MNTTVVVSPRGVERLVAGQPTTDGAGVKLTRVLTRDLQRRLDPFLMLDHFASHDPQDYGGGFPRHPHRGFETVTYMIDGRLRHRDSAGHEGMLQNGGVQWMTAGRGLIHSEMPEQENGAMEGFQLWLNLSAQDKLCAPWYCDIPSAEIPQVITPGQVLVRVIAGASHGCVGALQHRAHAFPTQALYLDLHFAPAGATFSQPLRPLHNAALYVYRGSVSVLDASGNATPVPLNRMAIFGNQGDGIALQSDASNATSARALLIAGQPLGEPIAQHGPFVMNTPEQLRQAVDDFNHGRLA